MSDLNKPLLNYSGLPPFSSVKPECIKEAVVSAIEKCKKTIIDVSEKFGSLTESL